MSELFLLYLWLKIDDLLMLCLTYVLLIGVVLAVWWIVSHNDGFDTPGFHHPNARKLGIIWLVALATVIVIPDSRQTAFLVATHYALKVADSPEGVKVVSLLRKKANEYIDEQLKESQK